MPKKTTKLVTVNSPVDDFYSGKHWNSITTMAETFLKSGALPQGVDNPAKVLMVLEAGREAGLKPVEALNSFYFVNGKLSMYGQRLISQVIKAGYKVKWGKCDAQTATVEISREDRGSNETTTTIQDATRRGLAGKDVWKKYPENMLRYKSFGMCARFFCPEALDGYYSKEELEGSPELFDQAPVARVVND